MRSLMSAQIRASRTRRKTGKKHFGRDDFVGASKPEYGMDWINPLDSQSSPVQADLDWTGSEIHQLNGLWIGLDPEMCNVYPIFRDFRLFLLIVSLTSEVLPSHLQLYTSSFVFTC